MIAAYRLTRDRSVTDCASLSIEDYALQAEVFVSPPKWHLAHTSWFFETFLLKPFAPGYRPLNERYEALFNSYYNGIGEPYPRDRRGLLSHPTLEQVFAYRQHVDAAMLSLLAAEHESAEDIAERTTLGIEHERQHQELMFTDIKYSLAANPLYPAFSDAQWALERPVRALRWDHFAGGLVSMGFDGAGFCFDNELPEHRVYLPPFELADRLISNGEYQAFVHDGGYARPDLWLADGWAQRQKASWEGPQHWLDRDGRALEYTLSGLQPRDPNRPVCHLSGYEADAFARWSGVRLPTEGEWEYAARKLGGLSRGRDTQAMLHPSAPASAQDRQYYGACWQWTQSAYSAYPGFRPAPGAIGEYNGKFMSNQWVLRGGSCVTWSSQARHSYRNFFYPQDRWQFSGIRLAR